MDPHRQDWFQAIILAFIACLALVVLGLLCGCENRPQQWAPVGIMVQYGPDGATMATVRMNPQLRQPTAQDFAQGEKAKQVALVGHCDLFNAHGATMGLVRMNPQLGEPKTTPPTPGWLSGVFSFLCDPTTIATGLGLLLGGGAAAVPLFTRLASVLRGAGEVVAYAKDAEQAKPTEGAIEATRATAQARQEENGTLPVVRQLIGKEEPARLDVWANRIAGIVGIFSNIIFRKRQ